MCKCVATCAGAGKDIGDARRGREEAAVEENASPLIIADFNVLPSAPVLTRAAPPRATKRACARR